MHDVGREILYRGTYDFLKLFMQNHYNYIVEGTMVNGMIDQLEQAV